MKTTFNKQYFLGFSLVFLIKLFIAKFINDDFIRPFVGDYLVMILIYFFSRAFIKGNAYTHILCVLSFCYTVEIGQKFNLVSILGLGHYRLAKIIIGTHYDFRDLIAYSLAALTLIIINRNSLSKC